MEKLESNFKNMVVALSVIALFAGLILATAFTLTVEPIAKTKKAKQQNAIKEVLPPFDRIDDKAIEIKEGEGVLKIYKAFDTQNQFVGAAVETFSTNGYNGYIGLMVGFDANGIIVNYSVLQHSETPGLGDKIGAWFKTDKNKQSIIGLDPAQTPLSVKEVDAITAATISSKAFLHAVQTAHAAFLRVHEEMTPKEVLIPDSIAIDSISSVNLVVDTLVSQKAYEKSNIQ
jgi:electron transport complex protein RnfG